MFPQNPFPGAFGLDIGDLSMKLIKLGSRKRPCLEHGLSWHNYFEVEDMRSISMPAGYIQNGELVQPENVRRLLLVLLGKEGKKYPPIDSPWVVSDLPEPKTFLKQIDIEIDPEAISEGDVFNNAKKHLPFELDEAYLDWEIIESVEPTNYSKVLFGAVQKTIVDSYTYLLESTGLQPLALEIEALSIARAMVTRNKDYTGVARAILDLGATRSSLVIYDYNTIQFSTNFDFSGDSLTKALAEGLKLSTEEAEILKIKNGMAYDNKNNKYLQIVMKKADKLLSEVKKATIFYKEHFRNANPITHITLCGGSANLKGLDVEISRRLKISTRPGNAWKNLSNKRFTDKDKVTGTAFSSAIGLALRAVESNV